MKRWNMLIAASVIAVSGATAAPAFEATQVQAVKDGHKDCPWCNLSRADLANVTITGVDLSGADLTEADLTRASITKVDLSGADLTGANLTGADLSGSNLTGADLDQVDLSDAILVGTILETANCDWATKFPAGSDLICMGVTVVRR